MLSGSYVLLVYVVEDSRVLVESIATLIQKSGARFIGSSGEEGPALLDLGKLKPKLVLIDIALRSGTGFGVLRGMREQCLAPGATIAVWTNYAYPQYRQLAFQLGANYFFDKAKDSLKIADLIRSMVASHRLIRANRESRRK